MTKHDVLNDSACMKYADLKVNQILAEAIVVFKNDCEVREFVTIGMLREDSYEENGYFSRHDDEIFFYVHSPEELLQLMDYGNGEDFRVTDIIEITGF